MKKIKLLDNFGTDFEIGQIVTLYEDLTEIKAHFPEVELSQQLEISKYMREPETKGFVMGCNFDYKRPNFMQLWVSDFEEV